MGVLKKWKPAITFDDSYDCCAESDKRITELEARLDEIAEKLPELHTGSPDPDDWHNVKLRELVAIAKGDKDDG